MKRNVIVELKGTRSLRSMFESAMNRSFSLNSPAVDPKLEGFTMDMAFPPVQLSTYEETEFDESNVFDSSRSTSFSLNVKDSTYLVRGELEESDADNLRKKRNVVGVYSDPQIQTYLTCSGPAVGDDKDVEKLLDVIGMRKCKMTGKGVRVAIVDTGVNMNYLNANGKNPRFDAANSWKPVSANLVPGDAPVDHGTMCAYDVCIAAPDCTLLDIALLSTRRTGQTIMSGFLSDAILAYSHLLRVKNAPTRPGQNNSLVVNNSWGMYHPSWDFPIGDPGNFSDNPSHPFNKMVVTLERAGADILFAAGNCGSECPDGRCQGYTSRPIYGANSSSHVLCVAGADVQKNRVGYSSKGPGRLDKKKPDITGYTHFDGSGVYAADGGTSAACPVVAGVVAAIRTIRPNDTSNSITSPAAIRNLVTSTALDRGSSGYDYNYGYGIINPREIMKRLCGVDHGALKDCIKILCKKYPRLCRYLMYCYRNPQKCQINRPVRMQNFEMRDDFSFVDEFEDEELHSILQNFEDETEKESSTEYSKKCKCNH